MAIADKKSNASENVYGTVSVNVTGNAKSKYALRENIAITLKH